MKRRELFSDDIEEDTKRKKALSPDARENQLIAYATNLAEKQLMEGTASSQVIVHYLKLGMLYLQCTSYNSIYHINSRFALFHLFQPMHK